MHFTIQLRLVDEHGDLMSDETILCLDKGTDRLGEIGLSLEEGKDILAGRWCMDPKQMLQRYYLGEPSSKLSSFD